MMEREELRQLIDAHQETEDVLLTDDNDVRNTNKLILYVFLLVLLLFMLVGGLVIDKSIHKTKVVENKDYKILCEKGACYKVPLQLFEHDEKQNV